MLSTCKDVHRRIVLNTPLALFIDNAFVNPARGNHMLVVDPADESVITTQCPAATAEDVDLAVAAANRAFLVWGKTTGAYVQHSRQPGAKDTRSQLTLHERVCLVCACLSTPICLPQRASRCSPSDRERSS